MLNAKYTFQEEQVFTGKKNIHLIVDRVLLSQRVVI